MNNYSKLPQVESNSTDELIRVKHQLDQALSMADDLRQQRDDSDQRYMQSQQEVERKDSQIEQKDKRINSLFSDLNWMRKLIYNPDFTPTQKVVLISAHDHVRTAEPARIFVGVNAVKIGVARNTYGTTLQKLDELQITTWTVATVKDGETFAREGMLTFSEQLLKDPDTIRIEKKENRGGNAKEKAAKKACPECSSVQVEEGKTCYCKNCNHQWEEGKRKDSNIVTPADEMREAATVKKPQPPKETLFEEFDKQAESKPKPRLHVVKDSRLPDRDCIKCGARQWEWDDIFDLPKCGKCG